MFRVRRDNRAKEGRSYTQPTPECRKGDRVLFLQRLHLRRGHPTVMMIMMILMTMTRRRTRRLTAMTPTIVMVIV